MTDPVVTLHTCPLCGDPVTPDLKGIDKGVVYMDGWHHRKCLVEYMADEPRQVTLKAREELHEPPMMRLGAPNSHRIVCPCGWESAERGNDARESMLLDYSKHAYIAVKAERDAARAKMMEFAQMSGVVSFDV